LWCSDFQALKEEIAAAGGSLTVDIAQPAGLIPIEIVEEALPDSQQNDRRRVEASSSQKLSTAARVTSLRHVPLNALATCRSRAGAFEMNEALELNRLLRNLPKF
jgi:hypothetical protein